MSFTSSAVVLNENSLCFKDNLPLETEGGTAPEGTKACGSKLPEPVAFALAAAVGSGRKFSDNARPVESCERPGWELESSRLNLTEASR